jgi:hypothetical protein
MKVRDSVKWFSEKMEKTLQENDYKGEWDMCDFEYLIDRLNDEVQEINELNEDERLDCDLSKSLAKKVIHECTDVANFAMMIADNLRAMAGER